VREVERELCSSDKMIRLLKKIVDNGYNSYKNRCLIATIALAALPVHVTFQDRGS
jgi:hypothetical protein